MPGRDNLVVNELEPVDLPIWREAFAGTEWLRLKTSRVYYGFGIPRGNGAAVVLVPGFLAVDWYLIELHCWLRRIGHRPYMSRIGHNAECPNILIDYLLKTVRRAKKDTGRKVHLVGHSFGGVLARSVASYHPELIESVVTLASPYRGVRVHPWVLAASRAVRWSIHQRTQRRLNGRVEKDCYTSRCACGFACTWRDGFPANVRQLSIYTKTDGIVDWKVCISDFAKTNIEVHGTHSGLAFNPDVYRILAYHLASAPIGGTNGRTVAAVKPARAKRKSRRQVPASAG
ncbi:MAG: alpha/beta fold hydrolase [Candidatus Hydrogenedentes bacterium]|nr:alpha/beta fold hydrolase [Candidatus Hydrogenedentota bacterium]